MDVVWTILKILLLVAIVLIAFGGIAALVSTMVAAFDWGYMDDAVSHFGTGMTWDHSPAGMAAQGVALMMPDSGLTGIPSVISLMGAGVGVVLCWLLFQLLLRVLS